MANVDSNKNNENIKHDVKEMEPAMKIKCYDLQAFLEMISLSLPLLACLLSCLYISLFHCGNIITTECSL